MAIILDSHSDIYSMNGYIKKSCFFIAGLTQRSDTTILSFVESGMNIISTMEKIDFK